MEKQSHYTYMNGCFLDPFMILLYFSFFSFFPLDSSAVIRSVTYDQYKIFKVCYGMVWYGQSDEGRNLTFGIHTDDHQR